MPLRAQIALIRIRDCIDTKGRARHAADLATRNTAKKTPDARRPERPQSTRASSQLQSRQPAIVFGKGARTLGAGRGAKRGKEERVVQGGTEDEGRRSTGGRGKRKNVRTTRENARARTQVGGTRHGTARQARMGMPRASNTLLENDEARCGRRRTRGRTHGGARTRASRCHARWGRGHGRGKAATARATGQRRRGGRGMGARGVDAVVLTRLRFF